MDANHPAVKAVDNIGEIIAEKICFENYRGVVISGDLTHCAYLKEFERYQQFISCFKPYAFDGLGNHDFSYQGVNENSFPKLFSELEYDKILTEKSYLWEEESLIIWDEIRTRERNPKVNSSYPNIHYSWDWEDVHFVQLNICPGDTPLEYSKTSNLQYINYSI